MSRFGNEEGIVKLKQLLLMNHLLIALLFLFACASCDKLVPEQKDPSEEELVTPEQKKALEEFGGRLPEA